MVHKQESIDFDSTVSGVTVTHQTRANCSITDLEPESRFLIPEQDTRTNGVAMSHTEAQQLKWHANAPKHVTEWNGVFDVTVDRSTTYDTITRDVLLTYGHVVATFHPEPVIGDRPRKTNKTWTITAPLERAMVNETTLADRDSYESDAIARFRYAPDIVRNWGSYTGWPFSVEINHINIAGETLTIEETSALLQTD